MKEMSLVCIKYWETDAARNRQGLTKANMSKKIKDLVEMQRFIIRWV